MEKLTHPDTYAVHQCARCLQHPKCSHTEVVKQIGRYLKATKELILILEPDYTNSFDCWVNTDFSRNWHMETALSDPTTSKS